MMAIGGFLEFFCNRQVIWLDDSSFSLTVELMYAMVWVWVWVGVEDSGYVFV